MVACKPTLILKENASRPLIKEWEAMKAMKARMRIREGKSKGGGFGVTREGAAVKGRARVDKERVYWDKARKGSPMQGPVVRFISMYGLSLVQFVKSIPFYHTDFAGVMEWSNITKPASAPDLAFSRADSFPWLSPPLGSGSDYLFRRATHGRIKHLMICNPFSFSYLRP
jgi:hypothetical protein